MGMESLDFNAKLQHWRGLAGIFGLKTAPVLEFLLNVPTALHRSK